MLNNIEHTLYGRKVIISNHLGLSTFSNKKHARKDWMGNFYHLRIQKKWDKRFGTYESEQVIITKDSIIMSPKAFIQVKNECEDGMYKKPSERFEISPFYNVGLSLNPMSVIQVGV